MASGQGEGLYRKITVRGVVQGVGFRPFVLRAASELGLRGGVRNAGGAVHVLAYGAEPALEAFLRLLREAPPPGAWIADISITEVPAFPAEDFAIWGSEDGSGRDSAFLSPDLGICGACLREIADPADRRFQNPFNSCVACGPRFTIARRLPYDRDTTSMEEFPLCPDCAEEYDAPADRRCHAQTICCNDCGPVLTLHRKDGESLSGPEALAGAVAALEAGKILAIKGIGGYHLACSPYDDKAVGSLRVLKGREAKPFAVMLRDIRAVREVCVLSAEEESLLLSPARPIVLAELLQNPFTDAVLGGDLRLGCFLPYTALHRLLLERLGALVLTSANSGGSAIFTEDADMLNFFRQSDCSLFAGVLAHNREIVRAAEDSVAQIVDGHIQLLRRSRGYAPAAVKLENTMSRDFIAMGGDLKAAFCLVRGDFAFQSPYFGDLEDAGVYGRFCASLGELGRLLRHSPEFVLCDLHPGYFSSGLAEEMGLPVIRVQHHHAHIASVMAEHGLHGKVLGAAFDGTGFGTDGSVWGGEFLVCEGADFRRAGCLAPVLLPGGDAGAKDARRTAFAYLFAAGAEKLEEFDPRAGILAAALANHINAAPSSSMGRLFDAAAAVLGLGDTNGYEGECAVAVQRAAELALRAGEKPFPLRFDLREGKGLLKADASGLVRMLYENRNTGSGALALGFHHAVAALIRDVLVRLREQEDCNIAALSGGVFQNRLLLSLARRALEESGFQVHTNSHSSPGDGGLALGQAYIGGKLSCVSQFRPKSFR